MLNYRPDGQGGRGRPLKRLLRGRNRSVKVKLVKDDEYDDDDELGRCVVKVDHRTEPVFMEMFELMRTAVNLTTMETIAFQQSVTRG